MDVLFYTALFLTAVFILPWFFLYAVPVILAMGAAGWTALDAFQNLLVPEGRVNFPREISTLDRLDIFPYTKTRAELRKVILISKSRNRSRNDRKAIAS